MSDIRISNLFESFARTSSDAPALIGIDGQVFTYLHLINTISFLTDFLTTRGVKPEQRIAVVNPNAFDMAVSYLAVSNVASFVPLRSDYSMEQYRYYFELLKANALLLPLDYEPALTELAEKMNMSVYYFYKDNINNELTYQMIGGDENNWSDGLYPAKNDDIASINYTSGTTSTPKIVTRSHKNIYYGVLNRLKDFSFNEKDRLLIITPMDRSVSLNMLLTALGSGGCAICAGSFEPEQFFRIINEMHPTWFVASPVVLQSIVDYAEKNQISGLNSSLRFIRSSGAPLSEIQAQRLNNIFNKVPVYITYGLTETGNIASSYNSPKGYRYGSVGVPVYVDLMIMDEAGEPLGSNKVGEIAVRGPQVIKRYDNDEEVNKASFYGEWFRTGDAGYVDEDGYLFITGRFKEIINRGGEKVSPYEVEDAILTHPDVLQAAVFPIPCPGGNEDVGTAVVLREGSNLYVKDLRRFLNGKVVAFKMPVKVYVMQEIPSSEAGKIQRKTLYDKINSLGIPPQPEADANEEILLPRNETEKRLYKIFKEILPVKRISITDTFFELGGDSLRAAVLFTEIKKAYKLQIPLKYIFNNGTIETLAEYIDRNRASSNLYPFLVPFQEEGSKIPIFFVHAAEGESVIYRHIAADFDPERPFYGIDFNPDAVKWEHPITFEQMAGHYIKDIRRIQSEGPYLLAGLCVGGIIAYEIARQLKEAGQEIRILAIYDPIIPGTDEIEKTNTKIQKNLNEIKSNGIHKFLTAKWFYYRIRLFSYLYRKSINPIRSLLFRLMDKNSLISYSRSVYLLKEYAGDLIIFKPENSRKSAEVSIDIWAQLAANVRIIPINGRHETVFYAENAVETKAVLLKELMDIQ